jgi:hypothetical protein
MRYDVVSHEIVLAALNSDPITAYVDAVIVPSKPARKTFENIAVKCQSQFTTLRAHKYLFRSIESPVGVSI